MALLNDGVTMDVAGTRGGGDRAGFGRTRLAREIFAGRFWPGQRVQLREIEAEYGLDHESALQLFAEFQTMGLVTLSSPQRATIHSADLKEMQEAFEIRAALEEIAGRTAASRLKGNTGRLRLALEAMRQAIQIGDLDSFVEHDVQFHRRIMESSENKILLRAWNTLSFDLRMRAGLGKVSRDLTEIVESHQPIIEALEKGRSREAGLLLRNHVETFLEYLKKSDSDSATKALRKDLEAAKDVQQAFFPQNSLSIPCLSCETFYQPARGIGGDYYDFISLEGGRWGIAIGDVSGKGIGAALIMASLQASLRAQALRAHVDLSTLIGDVNRLVHESSPTNFFASLFYAEYDPARRVMKYINAGHNPPLVLRRRNGSSRLFRLTSQGIPLGISPESRLKATTFHLEAGDIFVAYTDGITEAENRAHEQWGEERLQKLLCASQDTAPEHIIQRILDDVSSFAEGQPQRDDVTLVVMNVQDDCGV